MTKKLLLTSIFGMIVATSTASNLFVNNTDYEVDTLVIKHTVGPGTTYAYYRLPARPLEIHVLEMDLTNPYLNMEVWNGGNVAVACETPTNAAKRYQADGVDVFAVHNGDFFSTIINETGISRMGLFGAGEMLFNPTGNPLLVMDGEGVPRIDYVNFAGSVTKDNGESTRLHTVNQLRLEWEPATAADQLSLYTPAFGAQTHNASSNGSICVLRAVSGSNIFPANTELKMEVVSVEPTPGRVAIPADGAILHGVGKSASFLDALQPGDVVNLNLNAAMPSYPDVKDFRDAIGGSGHIILRNGEITNINNPDLHPRTFMGISRDRDKLFSVVVDGRYGGSAGIDLDDQGRVLKWLGAWDGLNLDGGGSSCVAVNGVIKNHLSDGSERAVGNGVLFYSTAPRDEVPDRLQFMPIDWHLPLGAEISPKIYAFNKYDFLITDSIPDFTLSCDPEIGYITNDGHTYVAARKAAKGTLTATTAGGLATSVEVTVCESETRALYDRYIVDNRRSYPLLFEAAGATGTFSVSAATIDWTSSDENVAVVSDGSVQGLNDGEAVLTGKSEHFNGEITIVTENAPLDNTATIFDPEKLTAKQTGGTGTTVTAKGTDGFNIDYTGNGTARGCYIQISPTEGKILSYGLPDAIELKINPGEAVINSVSISIENNHGSHASIALTSDKLNANEETTVTKLLGDIFDVTDNTYYPLTINSVRFEMGTSVKNKEYTIAVPSLVFRYDGRSEVIDIPVAGTGKPDNAPDNTLYRLDGTIAPENPGKGLLIRGDGTKIIVR